MSEYTIDVIKEKYSFVPRTLIFIQNNNKFLLIHKKKKDSYGYGKLNGVGGHIEKGEDPYSSARREILEETGLIVEKLDMASILFIDIGENPGIEVFVFGAVSKNEAILTSEEGELVWMSLEEISTSKDVLDDVPMLIDICNNHQIDKAPLIVKYIYDENKELRIDILKD